MSEIDFEKVADFFRLALYKTNKNGLFRMCDKNARKIFGIPEDEQDLSKYSLADMYEVPKKRKIRMEKILGEKGRPFSDSISVLLKGESKRKILFDVSWADEQGNITGLVREMEESSLLRSVRAIEEMPTGFYHIEYEKDDKEHKNERLTECNDRFAEIIGFENRNAAIGKNIVNLFHVYPEVKESYFKNLEAEGKANKPLLNYPFRTRRIDNNKTIHLEIDVHQVKNKEGKVIGREGTIRDVTDKIELKKAMEEAERRLKKTTSDISKFIHTFLHPVVNFSGNVELLLKVGELLKKTLQPTMPPVAYGKELGEKLLNKIIELRDNLPGIDNELETKENKTKDEDNRLIAGELKKTLTNIINVFDYSLQREKSKTLLDDSIRDTALWVLDELEKTDYYKRFNIKSLIKEDFIELLQNILFDHILKSAQALIIESETMKGEVEALRNHISLKTERKVLVLKRHDIGDMLAKNIKQFKPIFKEREIEIEYRSSGDLKAEISRPDIDRLIYNMLHNAYKYSYGGGRRFLRVDARELQPDNMVICSFESFGIPIKKEEIDSGKIFDFGYRSELVYQSDRDGTGVGLHDAKDVVEKHGGEIKVTSTPAGEESDPPEYKVPYITKISIRIPKKVKNKEE